MFCVCVCLFKHPTTSSGSGARLVRASITHTHTARGISLTARLDVYGRIYMFMSSEQRRRYCHSLFKSAVIFSNDYVCVAIALAQADAAGSGRKHVRRDDDEEPFANRMVILLLCGVLAVQRTAAAECHKSRLHANAICVCVCCCQCMFAEIIRTCVAKLNRINDGLAGRHRVHNEPLRHVNHTAFFERRRHLYKK